jgi:hypothetical protein
MEAFLTNTECFLMSPSWKQVLRSAISSDESDLDDKAHCFALWVNLVHGPELFKAVTETVLAPQRSIRQVNELIQLVQSSRYGLLEWLRKTLRVYGMVQSESEQSNASVLTLFHMLEQGLGVGNSALLT